MRYCSAKNGTYRLITDQEKLNWNGALHSRSFAEDLHMLKFDFQRDYDTSVICVIRVQLVIRKIHYNDYQARRC